MNTTITPDVATTQLADRIGALLVATPTGDSTNPLGFLAALVQDIADDEDLTIDEAIMYVAQQGENWMGGYDGRIGVNVYRVASSEGGDADLRIEWKRDDSTWVALGQLLDAVEDDYAVLDWFDPDWIEDAAE